MRVLLALLVAAQNPVVPAPPPPPSPTPDTAHPVIVATTDVHGRVLGWDYVHDVAAPGGLARAATILETLRVQYPDQVVLVDAGDLIEGNLFAAYFARRDQERPHPLVDALNAMQYDAATPGNHDLDRKSTRLNSSHTVISYAVFCLKKKKKNERDTKQK